MGDGDEERVVAIMEEQPIIHHPFPCGWHSFSSFFFLVPLLFTFWGL